MKVRNYGAIEDLDFEKNGIKVAAMPVPGPVAGKPPGFVPPPAGNPAAPGFPAGASPFTRPVRTATPTGASFTPAAGNPAPAYTGGTPTYYATGSGTVPGGRTANLMLGGTSVPLSGGVQVQPQPQTAAQSAKPMMTAEERLAYQEVFKERMRQQGKQWPPAPPPMPSVGGSAGTPQAPQ